MSWLMFLSLLKNIAECFMKAIKGLSFSSANEHPPYVNRRNFPPQQRLLSEALPRAFLSLSCLRLLVSCKAWPRSCHALQVLAWTVRQVRRCSATSCRKVERGGREAEPSRVLGKMQTFQLKCQRRRVRRVTKMQTLTI